MFKIQRQVKAGRPHSRKADMVLTIETPRLGRWLKNLLIRGVLFPLYSLWLFTMFSLEKTTGKRSALLVITGIGLGLGLSIGVFTYPQYANAIPTTAIVAPITIEIDRIKSTALGFDTDVTRGQVELLPLVQLEAPAVHAEVSASIGQGQAIIVQGTRADYSFLNLEKAQLGHEIMVVGSNGGWYRYKVIETRVISYDQMSTVFDQNRETLVLFTTNSLNQTATVVIARPLQ